MTFASKYGTNTNRFNANTHGREYHRLQSLYESNGADIVYVIDCLFINTKGAYGDAPVAGVFAEYDGYDIKKVAYMVNLPSHLCEKVREICADADAVADINAGRAAFKIYTYTPKGSNRLCYSVDWVDYNKELPF